MTQAKRIQSYADLDETQMCYFKNDEDGLWYLYLPGCGLANLGNHKITEHEDGTITANPSILTTGHHQGQQTQKHGYLEHGVWRDC